jgi:NAD(P)-dependent dehydrogenase (short-subunit alcohol dehydrogenase family)
MPASGTWLLPGALREVDARGSGMRERTPVRNRFQDKVAIVTGGSSGIGRAIAEELCKEGCSVGFTGISDIGDTTEQALTDAGYDVLFCRGDMADEAFCAGVVGQVLERWGKINYLVNNAFSFTAKGLDATRSDWERIFALHRWHACSGGATEGVEGRRGESCAGASAPQCLFPQARWKP